MASTNDLKNGLVLKLEGGQLWSVVEFQHVKPGKGPAFVRTKLKNVLSGKVVDKTFNAGVKVETATVDKRDMQFSYMDGEYFVFMDMETYDQLMIDRKTVADAANFLIEGFTATVAQHEGRTPCGENGRIGGPAAHCLGPLSSSVPTGRIALNPETSIDFGE